MPRLLRDYSKRLDSLISHVGTTHDKRGNLAKAGHIMSVGSHTESGRSPQIINLGDAAPKQHGLGI